MTRIKASFAPIPVYTAEKQVLNRNQHFCSNALGRFLKIYFPVLHTLKALMVNHILSQSSPAVYTDTYSLKRSSSLLNNRKELQSRWYIGSQDWYFSCWQAVLPCGDMHILNNWFVSISLTCWISETSVILLLMQFTLSFICPSSIVFVSLFVFILLIIFNLKKILCWSIVDYNVMLVSGVQRSESVIHIHLCTL